ncbi:MAG: TAXI family TRAP transporter solute-binding subunit [Xanthobacteraceae bacterium]
MESLEHIVRNRVRMFLRHAWLVSILGSLVLGGSLWTAFYFMTAPTVMRIAAGPSGSANVELVQVLTQKLAGERDKVRLHLVATGGPKESAEALRDDKADLAILPSTVGNSPDWPVVAIMRQNVMALIVPAPPVSPAKKEASAPEKKEVSAPEKKEKAGKGAKAAKSTAAKTAKHGKSAKSAKSDKSTKTAKSEDANAGDDSSNDTDTADANAANKLDKVAKLIGHRIGIVTGSVATRDLLNIVLNHYGVATGQVQVSLIDPKDLAAAVKADRVDAIFVAGSATGQAISDAVAATSQNGQAPSFIAIDQADGIAKRIPAFDSADIDAGTFGGNPPSPDDSLKSLSFPEYLVARKSFSHEAIGTLAKLIYSSRLALAAGMPGEIKIEAPSTDKDAAVLVHPGALAYLNDDQKSFFDKYGDDIFYGLLIFPIFGSAIAGMASYFHNNGRTRRLRLLQRLLDLVRKAHAAPSLEVLDQMQVDLDHLVVAIIHQTEREEYDQAVQMSFSLAIDQIRFAIAARRTILVEHGGSESKTGAKAAAA